MNNESRNKEQRPRSIMGVYALNKKGEILLIRSPKWKGKLVPPGGHIDYGETAEKAAIREMKEETGLDVKNVKLLTCTDIIEPKDFTPYTAHFVCLEMSAEFEGEQEVVLEKKEASEYIWLKPVEIVKRNDVEDTTKQTVQQWFVDKKECDNCKDMQSKWLRALSDYQNLQRETERRLGEWTRMSEAQILGEFLPVYDHLKLAINNEQLTSDKNPWLDGVRHVARQFEGVLKAHGIEEIKTVGEVFDASRHEAVGEEESDAEEGTIVREVEGGYMMVGKVLKVAKVIVAKKTS